jgi:hypothetical protein
VGHVPAIFVTSVGYNAGVGVARPGEARQW